MNLVHRFVEREKFDSYEDFYANYRLKVAKAFNFAYDVVDTYAAEMPKKRAIVWCNPAGEERQYTFGDVARLTNQTANYLKELGVQAGDRVMLILKRRVQYWFTMLALHKLGAVAIPATFLLTAKDVKYRCEKGNVKMIISVKDDAIMQHVENGTATRPITKLFVHSTPEDRTPPSSLRADWHDFDAGIVDQPSTFERIALDPQEAMLAYFSSGTAGQPKMVMHNAFYPLGHILTASYWQQCQDDGLHWTVSDSGWGKCVWGKLYGQWIAGSAVMIFDFDKFDAAEIIRVLRQYKVTTFCVPPTIYRFMIKTNLKREDWIHLCHATTAGEPLNPEVSRQFKVATGLDIAEGFGQTETVILSATWPWLTPILGSMGKPSPSYNIEVRKDSGETAGPGEEGELIINTEKGRPMGLFMEYWDNPECNDHAWTGAYYHTGDVVLRDENDYLWFKGRKDDLIKSSGYRISPFEVESVLMEHPAILECAVTGAPDEDRGVVIKASIVLAQGFEASEALKKEIQTHVKNTTAPYKYPRIIAFVKSLPKTISDKIRRVAIREADAQG